MVINSGMSNCRARLPSKLPASTLRPLRTNQRTCVRLLASIFAGGALPHTSPRSVPCVHLLLSSCGNSLSHTFVTKTPRRLFSSRQKKPYYCANFACPGPLRALISICRDAEISALAIYDVIFFSLLGGRPISVSPAQLFITARRRWPGVRPMAFCFLPTCRPQTRPRLHFSCERVTTTRPPTVYLAIHSRTARSNIPMTQNDWE